MSDRRSIATGCRPTSTIGASNPNSRSRRTAMRIFFVCRRVPFPPDRGDKIATFNQIRHLSSEHEAHVVCLGDGRRDLDNIPGLERYAKSVTATPVDPLIKPRALQSPRRRGAAFGG